MLLRKCCSVLILAAGLAAAAVFVEQREANGVLQRRRRANSGFLEELKQGNLEGECVEEICDYEEAREVFEDDDLTRTFWLTYDRRDLCLDNPCLHNGTCVYEGTSYTCNCTEDFEGQYCQTVIEGPLGCLYHNGHCQHFCEDVAPRRKCSCAEGYKLGEDGRQCVAQEEFPCGQQVVKDAGMDQTMEGRTQLWGDSCLRGECPWQVLVQLNGLSHCGGALIGPDWVVTAAHCIHGNQSANLTVVAGELNLDENDGTEQVIPVSMAIAHPGHVAETGDADVAVLRLQRRVNLSRDAVPVCLPTKAFVQQELLAVRYHTVSGWGKRTMGGNTDEYFGPLSPVLHRMSVPLHSNARCSERAKFNFTSNMLCVGYLLGLQQSCSGNDGSPLVAAYGSTHFLTGVVGWGRGCATYGYYGVYANMANFVEWVQGVIKAPPT